MNTWLEVNPDALAIAETLDKERKDKGAHGPLHRHSRPVKDNIVRPTGCRPHWIIGVAGVASAMILSWLKLREAGGNFGRPI